jgi:polar amino acid transport system substrate-binding protein
MAKLAKCLAGGLLLVLLGAASAGAATITIRADYWPPFNGEPKNVKSGYMIEVLREIFAPLGHTIDYQLLSWDDSLEAVRQGKFNAVVGANHDDAPGFVYPAETLGVSATGFFVKSGNPWKYEGIKSLEKVRLGVIEAYSYSEELDDYIRANRNSGRIVESSGDTALAVLIKMLQTGQVDVVAEDPSVMMFNLMDMKVGVGEVVAGGMTEEKQQLYVAFSPALPASKTYARQFDEGIRKLRRNGKLAQILFRYGLKDWVQ